MPFRDLDKKKFWIHTEEFKQEDGSKMIKEFKNSAEDTGITLLSGSNCPEEFPIESFSDKFEEKLLEIKASIRSRAMAAHSTLT